MHFKNKHLKKKIIIEFKLDIDECGFQLDGQQNSNFGKPNKIVQSFLIRLLVK